MKKVLRWILRALAAVVVLVAALALYIRIAPLPRYAPGHVELKVELTPARLLRGRKFADVLCTGCHLDAETGRLTGRQMIDLPREFGEIWSKNITQHPQRGIGGWTDGELAYLIRTGVSRDGQYIPPYMPKLPHLSDEDLYSIIAFLRSSDPLVQASDVESHRTKPSFLSKLLSRVAFKPIPYPDHKIDAPPVSDKVAYGRYLVFGLECYTCHSADFKTMNIESPESTPGYLGGGNQLFDQQGFKVYATNLTFDDETGIGRWTLEQFDRSLRKGFFPDNSTVRYPMEPMVELTDDDVSAIYEYLKTVPKLKNPRKVSQTYVANAADSAGKKVYYKYGCNSCHGDRGVGLGDLRKCKIDYPTDDGLRNWIQNAPSLKPGTKMPAWSGVIADNDYSPLIQYVRELSATN
jgi:hypothetical protein